MSPLIPECWLSLMSRKMRVKGVLSSNVNSFSLLFPNTFFLTAPPLSWVPRPRSSVIFSLLHWRQSLSILPLKSVANPFPPILPRSGLLQELLIGLGPLLSCLSPAALHTLPLQIRPPTPSSDDDAHVSQNTPCSYCRRKSPPRLDSEDLFQLDPDLPEWCSD